MTATAFDPKRPGESEAFAFDFTRRMAAGDTITAATVSVVRAGDASEAAVRDGRATGFSFDAATPAALESALQRAVQAYAQPALWQRLMGTAMAQDFSWDGAAASYMALYRGLLAETVSA